MFLFVFISSLVFSGVVRTGHTTKPGTPEKRNTEPRRNSETPRNSGRTTDHLEMCAVIKRHLLERF